MLNARRRERFVTPNPPISGKEIDKTSNCSRGSRCTLEVVCGRVVKIVGKVFSTCWIVYTHLTDTKLFVQH
jgi:hypothetical protein